MAEFRSWRSYWDFKSSVSSTNRYIFSTDIQEFLDTILFTSKKRQTKFPRNTILWRAQIGCREPFDENDVDDIPYEFERMKPIEYRAVEGRANPKGIPYLYLATDKNTAMAEVRPWKGQRISLGLFRVTKILNVVDFSPKLVNPPVYFKETTPENREESVWAWMNDAFSQPTTASDDIAAYAATQIIAEMFKNNGADGIVYRSSLGDGDNIMLFDLKSAEIVNCAVYIVDELHFEFKPCALGLP